MQNKILFHFYTTSFYAHMSSSRQYVWYHHQIQQNPIKEVENQSTYSSKFINKTHKNQGM
jgi:hypothetical protein